jgi:DNA-binding LacI/PurR family transcriptional regulator
MRDIAQRAGVSIATVSRVLNEPDKVSPDTRTRVLKIISQTGFVANALARGLASRSSRTVGILVVDVCHTYSAAMTHAIERRLTEFGYNVLLANTGGELGEKQKYLRVMLEKKVDGLVLVGSVFRERGGNEHIVWASRHVPIIMLNSFIDAPGIYSVLCDDAKGVAAAVDHLVSLGHRDLWFLSEATTFSGLAKLRGFRHAMQHQGLDGRSVFHIPRSLEGGRAGIRQLLETGRRFTAVLTGEDITAIGALKQITDSGMLAPRDVSVVGYNSSVLAEMATPRLTSVDSRVSDMATTAVDLLFEVLKGHAAPHRTVFEPFLVQRCSTAPPRG